MAPRKEKSSEAAPPRRRKRRSAEETRSEILDAAARRLAAGGPEALRLQDIARDVGISHPAILHHFGSRDGLVDALERRVTDVLVEEVGRVLLVGDHGDPEARALELVRTVSRAMNERGLARMVVWWVFHESDGTSSDEARVVVGRVAELLRARIEEAVGEADVPIPTLEDLGFSIRLVLTAMFGEAMFGDDIAQAKPDDRAAERDRFHRWLAETLTGRFFGTGVGQDDPPR